MKLRLKKNNLTFRQADELIEKYYEGKTSCREEGMLREFLLQSNLPDVYDAEKAIFGYFRPEKSMQKKSFKLKPLYRSIAAAAAIALVVISVYKFNPSTKNYAYVDGKKITNMERVKSLANSSLTDVSSENNVVEEQLEQFSDIEF